MQLNLSFRYFFLMLCMLVAGMPVLFGSGDVISDIKLLTIGQPAPTCSLKGIDNKDYSFPVTRRWNMVFYWSLFCYSCIEEIPVVQAKLLKQNDSELMAFFVSLDTDRMKKALVNFYKIRNLKQPLLMEQISSGSYLTADKWGVITTPSAFIVAPDGKIAWSHQGPMDIEKFFADFSSMVKSWKK